MKIYKIPNYTNESYSMFAPKSSSAVMEGTPKLTEDGGEKLLLSLDGYSMGVNIPKFIYPATVQDPLFPPIQTEREFDRIMRGLKDIYWFRNCYSTSGGDKYVAAIQAYIGPEDISGPINKFLAYGRLDDRITNPETVRYTRAKRFQRYSITKEEMQGYTRAMEYALKQIDKTHPPYDKIAYRAGYFNPSGRQYFSASKNPDGAVFVGFFSRELNEPPRPMQYSVIKSKNAHDIQAVQQIQTFKDFESEVLFSPKSKFIDVTDKTPKEDIEKYRNQIKKAILEYKQYFLVSNPGSCRCDHFPLEDDFVDGLIKSLKVYEQVD